MARWRLNEAHYLASPDSFWEQRETDRETGRAKIRKHPVPIFLDPKDPSCWTHRTALDISQGGNAFADGMIVVCREGKGEAKDIVFTGPVTPGMEPLDDEAKAESGDAKTALGWRDGDLLFAEGMTYADKMLAKIADRSGPSEEVLVMQKTLAEMMGKMVEITAINSELLAQMAKRDSVRRV